MHKHRFVSLTVTGLLNFNCFFFKFFVTLVTMLTFGQDRPMNAAAEMFAKHTLSLAAMLPLYNVTTRI